MSYADVFIRKLDMLSGFLACYTDHRMLSVSASKSLPCPSLSNVFKPL